MTKAYGFCMTILATGCLVLGGCQAESNDPVPVKGKVQFQDGEAVPNVMVRFEPQEDSNNKGGLPEVRSKEDGTFSLSCLKGRYKVTLAPVMIAQGSPMRGAGEVGTAPTKQVNPYMSQSWEVVVPPEGKEDVLIKVNR
jgi:hypothetical protein